MEHLFFRIQRRLERQHTHRKNKKTLSRYHIEELCYLWAQDFPRHIQFILSHFHAVNTLLMLALQIPDPSILDKTDFLLRHDILSRCLDHMDKIIRPLHRQRGDQLVSAIRLSHQLVLNEWDRSTAQTPAP